MTRGRKPKPPALKLLAGTCRPDRERAESVTFDIVEDFPEPPQHFNTDGMDIWNDLGPKLVAAGVLSIVDLYQFQQLCYIRQCHAAKQKAGLNITAADDNALRGLFSDFGMSWNARQKSAVGDKPKGGKFTNNGRRS